MTLSPQALSELFDYDSLTGEIRYKCDRGPKKAGSLAGSTQDNHPRVYLNGRYHKAAIVAWILHNGSVPQGHVVCLDRNPFNLRIDNLALSSSPVNYRGKQCRRRRRLEARKDIRYSAEQGLWLAWFKGRRLGTFYSRQEAIAARKQVAKEASNA